MDVFRNWMTIMVSTLNVLLILFGIVKVWSRNEQEWKLRELRLAAIEAKLTTFDSTTVVMIEVRTKVMELTNETERLRNRLDRFLDAQK